VSTADAERFWQLWAKWGCSDLHVVDVVHDAVAVVAVVALSDFVWARVARNELVVDADADAEHAALASLRDDEVGTSHMI
jgi:hypothetical protein